MEIQPDPELDLERAEKLYDSLKAAQGQGAAASRRTSRSWCAPRCRVKTDPAEDETDRKKQLVELEEMARDLATQLHVAGAEEGRQEALY